MIHIPEKEYFRLKSSSVLYYKVWHVSSPAKDANTKDNLKENA